MLLQKCPYEITTHGRNDKNKKINGIIRKRPILTYPLFFKQYV